MTSRRRQHTVDTAVHCHYADDPTRRPQCTLTAAVQLGTLALCQPCATRRSSVGKGQSSVPLPAGPQLDVLAWIGAAHQHANAADRTLAAAVTRARQAGHPWSDIGAQLEVSRQAAQQRFARASGHALPAAPDGNDKEATTD
jgi:hypothetical protein